MTDLTAAAGLRHLAFFYRTRAEYLATLKHFVAGALGRGEPVYVAVPGDRLEALRAALATDAHRVVFADMADLGRNPSGIIPAIRAFIDRHPGQRVNYVGEPAWPGRTAAELFEAAKHESLINLAFSGAAATIMCPYDHARLPERVLADAKCTHPELMQRGVSRSSDLYLGPGHLPPRCTEPLPPPPPSAEGLSYGGDLRPVRALVARLAAEAGLPEARASDLVLAVSEVAANTLRHTSGAGTLSVWRTRGEILCQIHDEGRITDPLAGRRRPPEQVPGHNGLWVVNQVCDLVEMRTGETGTTVRMHMSLGWKARLRQARVARLASALVSARFG